EALARLDLLTDAVEEGIVNRFWSLNVLSTGERMTFDLGVLADDVEHPYSIQLTQADLCRIVTDRLSEYPNVRLEWGSTVERVVQDKHGVTVRTLSPAGGGEYRAGWVVAADGVLSAV